MLKLFILLLRLSLLAFFLCWLQLVHINSIEWHFDHLTLFAFFIVHDVVLLLCGQYLLEKVFLGEVAWASFIDFLHQCLDEVIALQTHEQSSTLRHLLGQLLLVQMSLLVSSQVR